MGRRLDSSGESDPQPRQRPKLKHPYPLFGTDAYQQFKRLKTMKDGSKRRISFKRFFKKRG